MEYYLYLLRDSYSGRLYVGKTNDPKRRWKEHQTRSKKGKSRLAYAMRKAPFAMWVVAVYPSEEEALVGELLAIDALGTEDPDLGFNNPIAWQYVKVEVRRAFRAKRRKLVFHFS